MSMRRIIHLAGCVWTIALYTLCNAGGQIPATAARKPTDAAVQQKIDVAGALYGDREFKLAQKAYRAVLTLDPDNRAALVGLRLVQRAQEPSWTRENRDATGTPDPVDVEAQDAIAATRVSLQKIILPEVSLKDASVVEALVLLQRECDQMNKEAKSSQEIFLSAKFLPPRKQEVLMPDAAAIPGLPVDALVSGSPAGLAPAPRDAAKAKVTIEQKNLHLLEALRYVAIQTGMSIKIGAGHIWLLEFAPYMEMPTTEFKARPEELGLTENDFPNLAPREGDTHDVSAVNSVRDVAGVGWVAINRMNVTPMLVSKGVNFPPGASASYLPSTQKLIERNYPEELEKTRDILDQGHRDSPAPDAPSKSAPNP